MVEIKVTGNMPLEALANLTALGMHCMKNSEVHAAAIRILETEKNTEKKKTALAVETLPADPPGPAAGQGHRGREETRATGNQGYPERTGGREYDQSAGGQTSAVPGEAGRFG